MSKPRWLIRDDLRSFPINFGGVPAVATDGWGQTHLLFRRSAARYRSSVLLTSAVSSTESTKDNGVPQILLLDQLYTDQGYSSG